MVRVCKSPQNLIWSKGNTRFSSQVDSFHESCRQVLPLPLPYGISDPRKVPFITMGNRGTMKSGLRAFLYHEQCESWAKMLTFPNLGTCRGCFMDQFFPWSSTFLGFLPTPDVSKMHFYCFGEKVDFGFLHTVSDSIIALEIYCTIYLPNKPCNI